MINNLAEIIDHLVSEYRVTPEQAYIGNENPTLELP